MSMSRGACASSPPRKPPNLLAGASLHSLTLLRSALSLTGVDYPCPGKCLSCGIEVGTARGHQSADFTCPARGLSGGIEVEGQRHAYAALEIHRLFRNHDFTCPARGLSVGIEVERHRHADSALEITDCVETRILPVPENGLTSHRSG